MSFWDSLLWIILKTAFWNTSEKWLFQQSQITSTIFFSSLKMLVLHGIPWFLWCLTSRPYNPPTNYRVKSVRCGLNNPTGVDASSIKAITYTYNTHTWKEPLIYTAISFLFRNTVYIFFFPMPGFEPQIARECLLEFDTRSNDLSHHGWLNNQY